jgi:5-methylcytosine-specific restriction protein A
LIGSEQIVNETLANNIVARLKRDGHLSVTDLVSRLAAADPQEAERTLGDLVKRGDVKLSRGGQYYVSGHVTPPAQTKARGERAPRTAIVQFGVSSGSGVGFEVDGQLVMPGDVRTHQELLDLFRVSNMGGIRVSKTLGAVILISSAHNALYEDRQQGEAFHYTGEGRRGDQTLTRGNRAIDRSLDAGTPLLLFFKNATNEYEFQGEVRLLGEPLQEQQRDEDGMMRTVWVFPLEAV